MDPALTPPKGVPSEFFNPYTLEPYQTQTIICAIIITTLMISARIYTKKFIVKAVKWEDYTCLFGWATFIVYLALEYCIGVNGGGTHQWNLHYDQLEYMKRYTNYTDIVYSFSILATKTSILLLILRIFCATHRDIGYWLTVGLIIVNAIFYIFFLFVSIFLCSPRAKIWDTKLPGKCLDDTALYLASATFNTVSDIAMLSVPIFLIWNLQMSVTRKVGISAIFGTGALACICSVARLGYHIHQTHSEDYTYVQFQAALWTIPEVACGLLCSCLVIFPRLYQHLAAIEPIRNDSATVVPSNPSIQKANNHFKPPSVYAGREWIRMNDKGLPEIPTKNSQEESQGSGSTVQGDDTALDSAIGGEDLERATGRHKFEVF